MKISFGDMKPIKLVTDDGKVLAKVYAESPDTYLETLKSLNGFNQCADFESEDGDRFEVPKHV